jgi:hypothetical protein
LLLHFYYVEGGDRVVESFKRKFSCGFSLYPLLYCRMNPLTDEDLPALRLVTQAEARFITGPIAP